MGKRARGTSRIPGTVPSEAVQLCADDLRVSREELEISAPEFPVGQYSSEIFFVSRRGSGIPTHVVKVDQLSVYDPRHEFEALEFSAGLFDRVLENGEPFDVVEPVGYGTDPKFLVTRHQPGELLQPRFDAFALGRLGPEGRAAVGRDARMIARWLSSLHKGGARSSGGMEPDQMAALIADLAAKVGRKVGKKGIAASLADTSRHYLEGLTDKEREQLRGSRPSRGDARPKNFILGADGVLYGFDMEGFGFSPLEHDCACMHHSLEFDGLRTPATTRRASDIWREFFDEYIGVGNSRALVLLGYIHFVLDRATKISDRWALHTWKRKLRNRIWMGDRVRWLSRLTGDLAQDTDYLRLQI